MVRGHSLASRVSEAHGEAGNMVRDSRINRLLTITSHHMRVCKYCLWSMNKERKVSQVVTLKQKERVLVHKRRKA